MKLGERITDLPPDPRFVQSISSPTRCEFGECQSWAHQLYAFDGNNSVFLCEKCKPKPQPVAG